MNKVSCYKKDGYDFIVIQNDKLKVILCSLGASIYEIYYDNKLMNMSPRNIKNFTKYNKYFGRTIGRVANRIKDGIITVNNKTYELEKNENPNTLHGGNHNISNKLFVYEIIKTKDNTKVNFEVLSPDLDGGFPGDLRIRVSYIVEENSIQICFNAISNKDTVCSLTNHAYFTLNSKFDKLKLCIDSSAYTYPSPIDLLPIEVKEVPSYLDFRKPKLIVEDINNEELMNSKTKGYDHNFIFNPSSIESPKVILTNDKYILSIYTDFKGVQIYTDNYPNNIKYKNIHTLKNRGVALEPQDNLLDSHLLKKDKEYVRTIKYCFLKQF